MLIPNNPDIDFEELNVRINKRLAEYDSQGDKKLPVRFKQQTDPYASLPVASLNELLSFDDEKFIEAAFQHYLKRRPNPEESGFVERLRLGAEKTEILVCLRYSPEGCMRHQDTFDLKRYRIKHKMMGLPLIGRLVGTLLFWLQILPFKQFLNIRLNDIVRRMTGAENNINDLKNLLQDRTEELSSAQSLIRSMSQRIDGLTNALAAAGTNLQEAESHFQKKVEDLETFSDQLKGRVATLEARATTMVPSTSPDRATLEYVRDDAAAMLDDDFYSAFAERFRGTEEQIEERMRYYLPIVEEVVSSAGESLDGPMVDIGCGRGTWLNMLNNTGYQVQGVDLNKNNVAFCRSRGFNVAQMDALVWLQQQADNSVPMVSGFHVVEHLPFTVLGQLLTEAFRVLKPGGLLILETPNPENVTVGATTFYMDPTHLNPIPPALLEFMVDYKGFSNSEIHRLNTIPKEFALIEDREVDRRCNQLFYGSQDYTITAIKPHAM